MEKMGLGPTIAEFQGIIQDYLVANEIDTRFKDNRPGRDWVTSFLKRHMLTLKKGGMMQMARKSVTSDPFVIYGYYDLLEKEIDRLQIRDRLECIYNLDETGFPTDPSKAKTIGTTGVKTVRLTHGANRENITVLATCCADGTCLDPLIVFKGKKMQSTWVGNEALPDTEYAVTDSGWMTCAVFEDFFIKFAKKTAGIRPILLIMDGHLSHTSLATVELAIKENISIMKLPPHCTDLLQPLDVGVFAPLKALYDAQLTQFVQATGANQALRKSAFVDMVSAVWRRGLSPDNVKAGFRATGIVPLDRNKYNVERLDEIKLKNYNQWLNDGKPVDEMNNPIIQKDPLQKEPLQNMDLSGDEEQLDEANQRPLQQLQTPSVQQLQTQSLTCIPASKSKGTTPLPIMSPPGASNWTPRSILNQSSLADARLKLLGDCTTSELIAELDNRAPEGLRYVTTLTQRKSEKHAIEEVLHGRGRSSTPTGPRKVLSMHGQIITNAECLKEIKEREEKSKAQQKKRLRKKEQPTKKTTKPPTKKNKIIDSDNESTTSVSSIDTEGRNTSSDINISDILRPPTPTDDSDNRQPERSTTRKTPDSNPDEIKLTEDAINKYVAVVYTDPKRYYWGKVLKTFGQDDDADIDNLEVSFLKQKHLGSDPNQWTWHDKKVEEVRFVSPKFILYGPVLPEITNGLFIFPDAAASLRLKSLP
jgi:hypothetical protein